MPMPISRRQFVRQLAVFGGAALLFFPDNTRADAPVSWVALGPADKFRKDSVTQVDLPGALDTEVVSVAHRSDGNFLVFSARCTHLGCVVDWDGHHRQFICPCHGGRYDAAGKNVGGPPPSPLRTLATKVDDHGILHVQPPSARTAKK